MDQGWVKLHRKLLNSRVFTNEGLLKVWVWCLLKANHEKAWVSIKTGRGSTEIEVLPGQFLFGRKTAAKELRMKERTVYDRMLKLENTQNLAIQPNTHCSIISIINWDSYQDSQNSTPTGNPTGIQQPSNTNKNDKKYSRGKFVLEFFESELNGWDKTPIEKTIDGFISIRKTNQISSGVLEKEFVYWKQYSDQTINAALKTYVDGRHWEKGKGEKYLRGIIRGKDKEVQKENNQTLLQKAF